MQLLVIIRIHSAQAEHGASGCVTWTRSEKENVYVTHPYVCVLKWLCLCVQHHVFSHV